MVKTQLLVVGGGPAGLAGAIAAAESGVDVLIVDEGLELGGQLVKQTHKFFGNERFFASIRGFEIAKILKERAERAGVKYMLQTTLVGFYEDVAVAYNRKERKNYEIEYDYVLLATGASEKFLVFKNNHLPGVYGAGAVQTLMNQYGVLPGEDFLIVGAGNIGLIVAYQILQAGGNVRAIVEISDRIGGYEVHANKVKRMGVPILLRHTIVKALGRERVKGAVIAKVDEKFRIIPGTEREIVADTICLSVGLQPSVELAGQLDLKMIYIPELGGHVPFRDENMRTSDPKVFVAGDLAGIEEATSAMAEGFIAGYTIAQEITGKDLSSMIELYKKELADLRRGPFGEKIRKGLSKMGIQLPSGGYREEIQEDFGPKGKLRAVIECHQNIPCNPCEAVCPTDAISLGGNINGIPHVDYEKCVGCAMCVMKCPGLAIFMVQEMEEYSLVGIPYELLPLPEKGQRVVLMDRDGKDVGEGIVHRVLKNRKDKTHVVYVIVEKGLEKVVRHFRIPTKEEEEIVCRCEGVTKRQIEEAIDMGFTDFEELRRYLRIGMGPCGGRTCRLLTLGIMARKLGKSIEEISNMTFRPPSIPMPFEAILRGEEDE